MAELMNVTQTLSSMEVADMVEKEHRELLKCIRRYNNQLNEGNISPIDFWKEDTYLDERNRAKPCYQITKLGCEFIAHKTTGVKGTAFTAKYIVRFHQMEEALKSGNMIEDGAKPELMLGMSKFPAPIKMTKWYDRNAEKIKAICKKQNCSYSELYAMILTIIGWKYDLNAAQEVFQLQRGYYPKQPMDIVEFFPEFQIIADEHINWWYARKY